MHNYDAWKTTPPTDELREKLFDQVMDMTLTQVRMDLMQYGVLDKWCEKVHYDIRQRWVDLTYELRSE